jgi:hypothetical protein
MDIATVDKWNVSLRERESAVSLEIRVARSVAEVEALRPLWTDWQAHPNSDLDFYTLVLRTRPEILRPHVMVVYRDGSPEAMLVGRLEKRQVELRVGYLSLPSPKITSLTFICGGLLGNPSPEGCAALAREISLSLRSGEAAVAYFSWLRVDSPLYASVTTTGNLFCRDSCPVVQAHRAASLPPQVDQFYNRLSPKARKNQRWQSKKFLRDHPNEIKVDCLFEASDLDRMFLDVEAVAKKTYQRGLDVGFVDTAEMRDRLRQQAEKGWLRAYILYIKNRPAAFWIGTLYKGTFHSDLLGYDPYHARYSPGMFLIMSVIENFCKSPENSVSAIDFGLGDAQYKQVLGDRKWDEASVYLFAATLLGAGVNLMRVPIVLLDGVAKHVMRRTTVLCNIKRSWRNVVRERGNSLSSEDVETIKMQG